MTTPYSTSYRTWLRATVLGLVKSGKKPGLVFVNRIEEGREVTDDIQAALVRGMGLRWEKVQERVRQVTADDTDRDEVADGLRAGNTWVVVCTSVWNTGIDIPTIAWVVLDPGLSTAVPTIQSGGRGSRLAQGKSNYLVIVPPQGRARGPQMDALKRAGYDLGGPEEAVRLAVADAYREELGRLQGKQAQPAEPIRGYLCMAPPEASRTGPWYDPEGHLNGPLDAIGGVIVLLAAWFVAWCAVKGW